MIKADEEDGLYEEWDSTLNDGLEDEEWVELEADPNDLPDIEKYFSEGYQEEVPSELSEKENRLLNIRSISGWRKKKILKERKKEKGDDNDLKKIY